MKWGSWAGLVLAGSFAAGCGFTLDGPAPRIPFTTAPGSFTEELDAHDSVRWRKADGWSNGEQFNAGWRADHITFENGVMSLNLDDVGCPSACSNRGYASGEFASKQYFGFGRYEVRMKPARGSGLVSSFILHTGESEGTRWDEIDIEFLGKDTRRFQTNYWHNGVGDKEHMVDLPFDAADDFHVYAFEWTRDAIRWYADGHLVHTETGSKGPLPTHAGKIIMNFWPGLGIDIWTGPFKYTGPRRAQYDWIKAGPAANQVVVDDFETSGSVDAMTLSSGSGATINRFFAAGHIGEKALGLNYSVSSPGAAATASRVFSAGQDWSAGKYFNFWFYGTSSKNPFKVELLDNRAAASTSDTSERFEARFTDDFSGWKWISLPWSAFTRSADGQPAGAPSDGLTLTQTWGYSVSALGGIGNFRVDQVEVEHPLPAAAP